MIESVYKKDLNDEARYMNGPTETFFLNQLIEHINSGTVNSKSISEKLELMRILTKDLVK